MEPGEDPISSTIPMVSISSMSGEAHIWTTYERLAVEAYLQQLKDHGYFVPTFHIFELSSYRREKEMLFLLQRGFAGLLNKIEYEIFFSHC